MQALPTKFSKNTVVSTSPSTPHFYLVAKLGCSITVLKQRVEWCEKMTQPIKAAEVLECIILEVHRSEAALKFKAVSNSPCHLRRLQSQAFS